MLGVRVSHQVIPGGIPVGPDRTGQLCPGINIRAVMAVVFDFPEFRLCAIVAAFSRIDRRRPDGLIRSRGDNVGSSWQVRRAPIGVALGQAICIFAAPLRHT